MVGATLIELAVNDFWLLSRIDFSTKDSYFQATGNIQFGETSNPMVTVQGNASTKPVPKKSKDGYVPQTTLVKNVADAYVNNISWLA